MTCEQNIILPNTELLNVPYEASPENAWALACYTMTAKSFFSEVTFNKIAEISNWHPGYVVWAFKFWYWIMERGVRVVDYDLLDFKLWSELGLEGLKQSVSEKEFRYYVENTKDIEVYGEDIKRVLNHSNFTFHKKSPSFSSLIDAVTKEAVCEVLLDSCTLNNEDGFALHRVVVLGFKDGDVVFHDPWKDPRPNRKVTAEHFNKAWLEAVKEPELCIYSMK